MPKSEWREKADAVVEMAPSVHEKPTSTSSQESQKQKQHCSDPTLWQS